MEAEETQETNAGEGDNHAAAEEREERDGRNGEGEREQQLGTNVREKRYWEGKTPEEVKVVTDNIYKKIVAFTPNNIFEMPSGNATKRMMREITFLAREYARESHLSESALKILFILPHLLCQRTHEKSRTVEDRKALERRMQLWEKGEVQSLLKEAETLQKRVKKNVGRKKDDDKSKKFASLMKQGKVAKAGRELSSDSTVGTLPLNEDTIRELKKKHPEAREAPEGTKFNGEYNPPDPVIFERITGERICKHALHTHGAAGPSGLDAKAWKSMLSISKFGNVAKDLGDAVAALARKLATKDCQNTEAFTACRLIALNKNPGCRPIGIGEVLRRIIGKAILEVIKEDIQEAMGNLQLCAGQQAGCEAAVHAIREIFEAPDCEAVMLVDATNAFNTINREATMHNIKVKCPSFAKYVENTYKEPAQLIISDQNSNRCETIASAEGTTQGDPIACPMYGFGLSMLLTKTSYEKTEVKHVAYADDLAGAGKIEKVKAWWELIEEHGPPQGYHPNAKKSVLIVKPEHYPKAKEKFQNTQVKITKEGDRYLGSVIGTTEYLKKYVSDRVVEWVAEIERLAEIAKTQPHAAYTAFTFSMKHKWNFIMRTVPNIEDQLHPLEIAIKQSLIPALANGHIPSDVEREIVALPPRLGGMGMPNAGGMTEFEYQNSKKLTAKLTQLIVAQDERGEVDQAEQQKTRMDISKARETRQKKESDTIKLNLSQRNDPNYMKRRLNMAQEVGASNWLTALPIRAKGFSLNRQEFGDALALRYGWPVEGLPQRCHCGLPFDTNHAMNCKTGGLICNRHDEVRDITAQMLREVCRDVRVEPPLIPTNGQTFELSVANAADDAKLDVSARGFWRRGQRAFVDVRIFNPMARSYIEMPLSSAHSQNEKEKKRRYDERVREVEQGTFTPLVFTTSGGMAPQATTFYAHLAQQLAEKRSQPKSCVVAWMRCRLSFSLLRSAILCVRGTRSKPPAFVNVGDIDFEESVVESRIDTRM